MELPSAQLMELPVVGTQPPERADAARNRQRILEAAERLFADRGVSCTSMDAIAAAAGVGKGTLFRRFGDRSSLAFAVLDRTEQALQDSFLRGEPPLGPGAPPCRRLVAFGAAMLDNLELNGEILLDAEISGSAGAFLRSAPRAVHWLHVRGLVQEARPDCDADYVADLLLGPLSPQLFNHQRGPREMSLDQLKAGYADLVIRLLG
jgi:AcrR family transcriptional regulator